MNAPLLPTIALAVASIFTFGESASAQRNRSKNWLTPTTTEQRMAAQEEVRSASETRGQQGCPCAMLVPPS